MTVMIASSVSEGDPYLSSPAVHRNRPLLL